MKSLAALQAVDKYLAADRKRFKFVTETGDVLFFPANGCGAGIEKVIRS